MHFRTQLALPPVTHAPTQLILACVHNLSTQALRPWRGCAACRVFVLRGRMTTFRLVHDYSV